MGTDQRPVRRSPTPTWLLNLCPYIRMRQADVFQFRFRHPRELRAFACAAPPVTDHPQLRGQRLPLGNVDRTASYSQRHVSSDLLSREGQFGDSWLTGKPQRQHAAEHEQRHVASESDGKGMRVCRDVLPRSERAEEDAADDRDAECGTDLERRDDGPRWMGPAARIRGGILSWRPSPSRRADVQHYCDFQFRDSGPGSARDQRTVRKNARISFASSSGCSRAGKCPPRSMFVQRVMFPYMRSASDRGGRRNSFGNSA